MSALAKSDRALIHRPHLIGGREVDTDERIEVFHPYDNSLVGTTAYGRPEHAKKAFEIAAGYRSKLTRHERAEILQRTAEMLVDCKQEMAELITAEAGLCMKDSLYEAGRAYDVFHFAAQLTLRDDGEIFSCDLTPHGKKRKIFTLREPLTAISGIVPFNHPLNMVAHKVAPAIATNNCLVLKPAEQTPFASFKLADLLYEAGLPPEMYQIISGVPAGLGDSMIQDPNIELVTFTGSVPVGKYIAENAGYRRTVLELGGNDPLIIMEDADLDKAAELAVAGATKNSGQRCTAVKRILCMETVADDFVALVTEKAKKIKYGDPFDPETDLGTVIDEKSAAMFERRVADAVSLGAEALYAPPRQGALFPPTVVDKVPFDCELVREETFGPVIPIIRCPNLDRLIEISNSTAFGLSSGVCTNNWEYIQRFIAELKVGTVNVWEVPGYRIEMSPFGGIKDSGLGYKEGVWEAMKSYTNVKTYSLPWF